MRRSTEKLSAKIEPIRGKVARILNSREVAINRGSSHGVEVDMVFNILSPSGSDIKDPDTGEILGSYERTKVRVKVKQVQERISIASTYMKYRTNVGGAGALGLPSGGLSRLFEPPNWVTNYETLRTEEAMLDELSEEESYVKIGDPIVQVTEFDDEGK